MNRIYCLYYNCRPTGSPSLKIKRTLPMELSFYMQKWPSPFHRAPTAQHITFLDKQTVIHSPHHILPLHSPLSTLHIQSKTQRKKKITIIIAKKSNPNPETTHQHLFTYWSSSLQDWISPFHFQAGKDLITFCIKRVAEGELPFPVLLLKDSCWKETVQLIYFPFLYVI